IATPYAFSYDMAALAIPVAFVARDQLRDGLLRREQATLLALFGIVLAAFGAFWVNQDNFDFGRMPLGLIALVTVMFLIMRRAAIPVFFQKRQWTYSPGFSAQGDILTLGPPQRGRRISIPPRSTAYAPLPINGGKHYSMA